ncbi:MAG: hypothetical protein ACRDZY_20365 [Acidimicrobiales bacterium]
MDDREPDGAPAPGELIAHLVGSTPLRPAEASRVVAEVLAYFSETTEQFVRRRHRELQADGRLNPAIWPTVAVELAARRVRPPTLSERQLRRLVYG